MLVKNRSVWSLETALVGPLGSLRYEDAYKYAYILESGDGSSFGCSMAHAVPIDSEVTKSCNEL